MEYKISYAASAFTDLIRIYQYIEESFLSKQAADNTIDNIMTSLEKLKIFPDGNLKVSSRIDSDVELEEDYYFTFVGTHLAFYEISKEVVSMVRILNARQDWISLFRKKQ